MGHLNTKHFVLKAISESNHVIKKIITNTWAAYKDKNKGRNHYKIPLYYIKFTQIDIQDTRGSSAVPNTKRIISC